MKKMISFLMFLTFHFCISQNINIEISDYAKNIEGKNYSTFNLSIQAIVLDDHL